MGVENESLGSLGLFFREQWYEKSGLAAGLIVGIAAIEGLLVAGGADWWLKLSSAVAAAGIISLAWWWSGLPPKTRPDRVGFLVAITSDDDKESKRLQADFTLPLRQLIRSGRSGQVFDFIELPLHLARKIADTDDAERIRVQCRAHFMIFGRVRRRTIDGHENHVVDLDGIVAHKAVPDLVKQRLAGEFSELLPRRVRISTENDLLSFYFTSEWADLVAKYIIGIAAAVSGDIDAAESLYLDAQARLSTKNTGFPVYQKLAERLPVRLAEVHEARAIAAYEAWQLDHESRHIDDITSHIKRAADTGRPLTARLNFLAAIHAFLRDRNPDRAFEFLRKVKDPNSALWNFNMAFLHGYKGNLKQASQHYRAGSLFDSEPALLSQVEEFMCWVLSTEPQKYQISYCLALFNWRAKGDLVQACKDFEIFLQSGQPGEFTKERELSREWISRLKGMQRYGELTESRTTG